MGFIPNNKKKILYMNGRYDTTCSKARLILNKSPDVKRLESSMFLWTVQYLYYYFVMFLLMKISSSQQLPKSNGRVHMIKRLNIIKIWQIMGPSRTNVQ